MRKLLALMLAMLLMFSLVACGGNGDGDNSSSVPNAPESSEPAASGESTTTTSGSAASGESTATQGPTTSGRNDRNKTANDRTLFLIF